MDRWQIVTSILGLSLAVGQVYGQTAAEHNGTTTAAKPAEAEIQAKPAMWKVKGVHGSIYLFGSVHVMKPTVHWQTAKVDAAFKDSGTLYLEVADTGAAATEALKPLVMSLGMDASHPLSTKISKEDVTALDEALKKLGAPGEAAVESLQPWLVYVTLAVLPAISAGYDPTSGVDRTLQTQAEAAHKPVKGFETAEEQLHFLADFSQPQQVALLHETIAELPNSVERTNEMVADWERGDVEKIAASENDDLKVKHPDVYAKFLVGRNEKISDTLAAMLKDPSTGTVFVAVGAAHLAGPDSILKMLEKRGYSAVREE